MSKITFGDLFCGCGGFSEGFRQAGLECVWAVDNWKVALESHRLNHPGAQHILDDIRNISGDDLEHVDVIIGSPPCQNFTTANRHKNEEEGLKLVLEFERIIREVEPKWWVWENVPLVKKYYPHAFILNAFDFGLNQRRKRAFISNFNGMRMRVLPGGLTPLYGYDGHNVNNKSKSALKHLGQSMTVMTQRIRNMATGDYVSIEEVRRLQGFPPDYQLSGKVWNQQKQLGNAVPPPISKYLGELVLLQNLTQGFRGGR